MDMPMDAVIFNEDPSLETLMQFLGLQPSQRPLKREAFPDLFQAVEELAAKMEMPVPPLNVQPGMMPNAMANADGSITFTMGLLTAFPLQELRGVIAHEMSHLKHENRVKPRFMTAQQSWDIEYRADADAVLITGDKFSYVQALRRLRTLLPPQSGIGNSSHPAIADRIERIEAMDVPSQA